MWLEFQANLLIVAQVAAIASFYVQIMQYLSRVDIENQRIAEQMEDLYMDLSDAPGLHYDN
jgi:hypothetical protein